MATKTANLYARIEPELKEEAESILSALGVASSSAITMFYRQIVLHRGLPFDVSLPEPKTPNVTLMTEEQLHAELEKGYEDMKAGRTKPSKQVFADIRKEYGL